VQLPTFTNRQVFEKYSLGRRRESSGIVTSIGIPARAWSHGTASASERVALGCGLYEIGVYVRVGAGKEGEKLETRVAGTGVFNSATCDVCVNNTETV
jgi:hypothetical protein